MINIMTLADSDCVCSSRKVLQNGFVRFRVSILLLLGAALVSCPLPTAGVPKNNSEILDRLLRVLGTANVSGSMEIRCQLNTGRNLHEMPSTAPAGSEGDVLKTVRSMFASDPAMSVTRDQDGTIRMRESGVLDDILRIKLRQFEFDRKSSDGGIYAPNVAVLRIMLTPEVANFRRSRNIEWRSPFFVAPSNLGPPSPQLPHISGSLENVTVSQVMDRVLKTFPGIWIYENCPAHGDQKREVRLRFVTLAK